MYQAGVYSGAHSAMAGFFLQMIRRYKPKPTAETPQVVSSETDRPI